MRILCGRKIYTKSAFIFYLAMLFRYRMKLHFWLYFNRLPPIWNIFFHLPAVCAKPLPHTPLLKGDWQVLQQLVLDILLIFQICVAKSIFLIILNSMLDFYGIFCSKRVTNMWQGSCYKNQYSSTTCKAIRIYNMKISPKDAV